MKIKFSRNHRGFTLIEMLIVIGIIGILAVGLGRLIIGGPQKARDASRKQAISQLVQAIEAYNVDKGKYPELAASTFAECTSKASGKVLTSIESYFPGKKMPVDPSNATRGYNTTASDTGTGLCTATEGFQYIVPKDTLQGFNYMIIAKMEDTKQGNLPKGDILLDGTSLSSKIVPGGEYYVVVQ